MIRRLVGRAGVILAGAALAACATGAAMEPQDPEAPARRALTAPDPLLTPQPSSTLSTSATP